MGLFSCSHYTAGTRAGQPARSVTHYTHTQRNAEALFYLFMFLISIHTLVHKTSMSIYALLMHIVNAAAHSEYVFTKIVTYSFNLKFIHKYVLLFARRSDEEKWQHRSYIGGVVSGPVCGCAPICVFMLLTVE